jgi:tRNA (adenine57-N1/adenine58-N1)-methyltransferase catalytic subunit
VAKVQAGDRVLLLEPETSHRFLVELDGKGARKERGLGVFDPARLQGLDYGSPATIGAKRFVVLRPTPADLAATIRRQAQVILPKDASRIVHELGLGPGDRVLESGIGSGAATVALLAAVRPQGEVVAQELRADFAEWAADNIRRSGLDGLTVRIGDLTQGLAAGVEGPFQACLLDQPEPWKALPHVVGALDAGARVACYCPQVVQMEETVRTLRGLGFLDVRAMELIERAWEVKERGSRPSFDGLGHTGFLVFARWARPMDSSGQ